MAPHEQDRHQKAFEQYHALGPKRTYKRIASDLGVSLSTVKQWSKRYNWRQRVAERDAESARHLADSTLRENATKADRNLRIVQLALLKLARDIKDGKIKGQMADVDRMIRLEEHISGADGSLCRDPSHSRHPDFSAMTNEQLIERLRRIVVASCRQHPAIREQLLASGARHG